MPYGISGLEPWSLKRALTSESEKQGRSQLRGVSIHLPRVDVVLCCTEGGFTSSCRGPVRSPIAALSASRRDDDFPAMLLTCDSAKHTYKCESRHSSCDAVEFLPPMAHRLTQLRCGCAGNRTLVLSAPRASCCAWSAFDLSVALAKGCPAAIRRPSADWFRPALTRCAF